MTSFSNSPSGTSIEMIPENINIADTIEKISWLQHINTINAPINVMLQKRTLPPSKFRNHIISKFFAEENEELHLEIEKTIDFLNSKMENLFPILIEKFWISEKYFLEKIFERLAYQLKEAKSSGRKYTNGKVVSLQKIQDNGDFVVEEIPYFAFGSTNVSLDFVSFDVNWETKTLREIMEIIGLKDQNTWEFFLPNSLWVSVMIILKDGTVVCQERNNKATLNNYNGLTSSASGAVNMDAIHWGPEILKANAVKEIYEEIGIDVVSTPFFPYVDNFQKNVHEHMLREINLDGSSGAMVPTGVVMERKRHNPEVVFTLFLNNDFDINDIKKKWENASDKWESIDLVWKSIQSIEDDIKLYAENMTSEEYKSAQWLEKFIEKMNHPHLAWPHLLMSYLAYLKAIKPRIEDIWKEVNKKLQELM